jgi:multidrug efflux pump subunit AcrA (membrane-fusion protein)
MAPPLPNMPKTIAALPQQSVAVTQAVAGKAPVQAADGRSALLALLKVESDARDAKTTRDLIFMMANETRKLTRARQIFVALPGITGALEIQGVSSLPAVDRNAPLIIFIEKLITAASLKTATAATDLDLSLAADDETAAAYPFRSLYWLPLRHGDRPAIGGLVLAREDQWAEQDLVVANRLAAAFTHSWLALSAPQPRVAKAIGSVRRWPLLLSVLALLAIVFVQVPLTALAPVEIVARNPFIVAAPIDGVIDAIAVEPNQAVKPGDQLVKLTDTTLKSRFEVAERDASVSEARLKQSNQIAFSDPRGMHELGIARAELEVKIAEREFAREMLAKTQITAQSEGLAIYFDKRELVGRPVSVGERILEIANPEAIEARIELPVSDAIALQPRARVKVFLDSDPLRPWPASIKRSDYKARVGENDSLAFRVVATLDVDPERKLPRLGVRGTAQVSGDNVSLGFFLFRRPITAFRQWTGL